MLPSPSDFLANLVSFAYWRNIFQTSSAFIVFGENQTVLRFVYFWSTLFYVKKILQRPFSRLPTPRNFQASKKEKWNVFTKACLEKQKDWRLTQLDPFPDKIPPISCCWRMDGSPAAKKVNYHSDSQLVSSLYFGLVDTALNFTWMTAGLIVQLSRILCTCLLLKFERPMLLTTPSLTKSSIACKIHDSQLSNNRNQTAGQCRMSLHPDPFMNQLEYIKVECLQNTCLFELLTVDFHFSHPK